MAVSSTTGGLRTGVCLSTDRPQNPYNGQVIYETDTNRTLVWDNSAWVVVADPALVSFSGSAASVTGNLTGDVTGNVTGDVTGDLTGDVAAAAVTIGGENVTPYTGRRNLVYNGAMQVAQRGTSTASITSSGYYTADRWHFTVGSMGTWTQSVENDAPTGSGFRKSLKALCTAADAAPAAGDLVLFYQPLEGFDLQQIKKGTSSAEQLTVSFWVKSNATGTYIAELYDVDNTRQVSASYSVVASGTWEKKTITFPADTTGVLDNDNASSLAIQFWLGTGTTYSSGTLNTSWASNTNANRAVGQTNLAASTNNYWQVTGVQLEVGDKATPFEHRSYGEELALCQRYYETSFPSGTAPSISAAAEHTKHLVMGDSTNNYSYGQTVNFAVQKRATPSITIYSSVNNFFRSTANWSTYTDLGTFAVSNINQNGFVPAGVYGGVFPSGSLRGLVGGWVAVSEL